jgi:hypothetical protein
MAAPRTIRVFWRHTSTGWHNFNWNGVITPQSVIHISACEATFPDNNLFGVEGLGRQRGAAPIWVKNVHPHGPNPGDTITYKSIGPRRSMLQPILRYLMHRSRRLSWGSPLSTGRQPSRNSCRLEQTRLGI